MKKPIAFNHSKYSNEALTESLNDILSKNSLGAMASVCSNQSHINTIYFVYADNFTLYFLSQPTDKHSVNITENSSVAVAVCGTPQQWGKDLQGIQLFGKCEKLSLGTELVKAMSLFLKRFPAFKTIMTQPGKFAEGVSSKMYAIRISSLKILDEPRFGRRNYVNLDLK